LLDTKGPEIRVCKCPDEGVTYEKDSIVTINCLQDKLANSKGFSVTDSTHSYNMAKDVKVWGNILVDDGKLNLQVLEINVTDGVIKTKAMNTHTVKTNKRINLPGAKYSMQFLSDKDVNDLKWACQQKVDYVAPSFVNSVADVNSIRKVLDANGGKNIKIISKIESLGGIQNLAKICAVSDGIMVARGDLGLDFPYYAVPYWEEVMVDMCRKQGKICIVATQMLDSMEKGLMPTRAEVMDVYVAGKLGASATMTSGETAAGQFPIQTIETMSTINKQSENDFDYEGSIKLFNTFTSKTIKNKKAVSLAKTIATKVLPKGKDTTKRVFPYEFVVLYENCPEIISAVSAIHPAAAIIVVTDVKENFTKFGLNYGIYTYYVENLAKAIKDASKISKKAVSLYSTGNKKYINCINGKFSSK